MPEAIVDVWPIGKRPVDRRGWSYTNEGEAPALGVADACSSTASEVTHRA
jgi:hypothetical protein